MPTNRRYPLADIMGALREAFPYDKRKVRYGGGWRLAVRERRAGSTAGRQTVCVLGCNTWAGPRSTFKLACFNLDTRIDGATRC